MNKSSIAVIIGPTILLGSKPYRKTIKFKEVEHGMDITNVSKTEIIGIKNKIIIDKVNFIRKRLNNIAAIPIMLEVANDKVKVAVTF